MRVTIGHTFDFRADRERVGGRLTLPEAWDAARATNGAFGLPDSRAEWERRADLPELRQRASAIVDIARGLDARSICSYGVGTGSLELNLHRVAPDLAITCTDYAPRATERLQLLFPEATVVVHDLSAQDPPAADIHLMSRIDTELDAAAWKQALARFTQPVLLVPVLLLDVNTFMRELARRVLKPRATRAGWLRSEDALRALWADTHRDERIAVADMPAFLLRRWA